MTDEFKSIKFITPRGIAVYPRLNKPDSGPKGKESKVPKYSVRVRFAPTGSFIVGKTSVSYADFVERLEEMRDEFFDATVAALKEKLKGKKLEAALAAMKKVDVFPAFLDKEGEETGEVSVNAKTVSQYKDKKTGEIIKKKPTIFDAKGVVIKKVPQIGGGSEMKVAASAAAYYVDGTGAVGITYYLDGVQLLKLVEFGARSAESLGFGAEEGYDASEGESAFDDEEADDSADTKSAKPDDAEDF